MNLYRLQQHLGVVLQALDTDRDLIKFIFILARGYRQIVEALTGVVYEPNRTAFSRQQMEAQERFLEFRRHAERFSIGSIFHEIIQFKSDLQEVIDDGEEISESLLARLPDDIDDFYNALEQFVKTGKDDAFTGLMAEAHNLYPVLITARRSFKAVEELSFRQDPEISAPDLRDLKLGFERDVSYQRRVRKLTAAARVYELLMDLLPVDPEAYPLELIRLETGGKDLQIRGHQPTLDLYASLLRRFALFLYHRCSLASTSSIPERVIATQSLINLADELELAGHADLASDERRLKHSALHLLQAFVVLLAGDPVIYIDERRLAVEDDAQERYIQLSQDLLDARPEPTQEALVA